MPKTIDSYAMKIIARFQADLTGMADDLFAETIGAMKFEDFTIIEQMVYTAADEVQLRFEMAADSAAWQGYQLGRVEAMDMTGQQFAWVLDPGAQHCETCLEYASGGPYTMETLPGIPGDAPTICDGGCRCNLVPV